MQLITLVAIATALFLAVTTLQAAPSLQRPLADAEYYMKDVDKNVPKLTEKAKNAASMAPHELQAALNEVNWAGQKLNNVLSRLAQLPADDDAVKALQQRAANRASELLAAQQVFQAAQAGQAQAAEAAAGSIEEDAKQLQALERMIHEPTTNAKYAQRAIDTVSKMPELVKCRDAMAERYAGVLGQHVGTNMNNAIRSFDYKLQKFRDEAQKVIPQLPGQVEWEFGQVERLVELAKERGDTRPFTAGGIQQSFARTELYLQQLELLDPGNAEVKRLRKAHKASEKLVAQTQASMETQILEKNTTPKDLYNGGDKAAILALVEKAWKKKHSKEEVLAMHIPMHAWERRESWRWAIDRFMKEDMSEIQVAILVKASDEIGHVYYAVVDKDHLAGDKTRVHIDDKGEVLLYRKFLMKNFK
ncbi:MAG: hypothetical protein AAF628_01620 [Planctomycetota bacterium]